MAQLILYLKERELSRHPLTSSALRIGRDPTNELVIDNVGISRHHATIYFNGSAFIFRDEGSQNGSYIAGQRVESQALRDGDVLQLGKFSLKFCQEGAGRPLPSAAEPDTGLPRRARDPQSTVALGAEDVAKIMQQAPSGAPLSPETHRQPPPPQASAPGSDVGETSPLLWIALGLIALIFIVAYVALVN